MNKLTDREIDLIDKIILFLNKIPGKFCSESDMEQYVKNLEANNIGITALIISLCICDKEPLGYLGGRVGYKLSQIGCEVLSKHGTYKEYLRYNETKEKIENEIYDNSKNTMTWTKLNTVFVILTFIVSIILWYVTYLKEVLE